MATLRSRQRLGKYRIVRRLGDGGFATVYEAQDTIEGIRVALKVPQRTDADFLRDFQREARITAGLDHPNILPIKNADFVDGVFVIVTALAERTLADRMKRPVSLRQALDYAEQLLEALAFAHAHRIIHCDVKPDNVLLYEGDWLRLMDFGIAKIEVRTRMSASGSGTLGYLAPEQAMGKPSYRSDCFAAGLILYKLLARELPRWPYDWPPPGFAALRRKASPQLIAFLRKSMAVNETARFRDASAMLAALQRIRRQELARDSRRRKRNAPRKEAAWKDLRIREFRRRFGRDLATRYACGKCRGPVAEAMLHCPWCGDDRRTHRPPTRFPARCPRCRRGRKLDWRFCPWCYGGAVGPDSDRSYTDKAYVAQCTSCHGDLMPFMRYCPWCNTKERRAWTVDGIKDHCRSCEGPVLPEYWKHCPWCSRSMESHGSR